MSIRISRLFIAAILACWSAEAADTLKVMTFNVRYPASGDGVNVWESRRTILTGVIREQQPDVVGTQELFQSQGDYIVSKLPDYAWFGLSRRGNHEDEHMGVFYRKSRLELKESGNFWLSETPDQPGSMSWNVSLPRMVTWADFTDKKNGKKFRFYNTHFPHRRNDEDARKHSAQLIAERIKTVPAEVTVIVTGDFNTDIASEAHAILTESLKDAWKEIEKPIGPTATFHGFSGTPTSLGRIDWILYRGALVSKDAETITTNENGRYPSDHFPVAVTFEWK